MILAIMFLFQMNCSMQHRGDAVMGFSHETTTHAFKIYDDGGAIEVVANDAGDAKSTGGIRAGARVRITTSDAKALDAVHRFLEFQIREHHTERDPAHAHSQ